MSYNTQILYNGIDAFFPQPTPMITIDYNNIYYTELWTKTEEFILKGVVTGCDFPTITNAAQQIIMNFAQNYQTLVLQETDNSVLNIIYTKNFVEIKSIDFTQSIWRGVLPYTIKINSFPSGFFSGAYGILNPVDKWDYQEKENLSMDVTHTVSAQGLSLNSGATFSLNNVTVWIQGRTGLMNAPNPFFIINSNKVNFYPTTIEEKINRIDGNYEVIEKYTNDLTRSGYGLLRYTTSISSGYNLISVDIEGSIEGGNRDITDLRKTFSGFNIYGAASNAYSQLMQEQDLNPYPLIQKVTEDVYNSIISFSYSYDNDPSPQEIFDYTVTITSGNKIDVKIEGDIKVRGGDILQKYTNAINYAGTLNLYSLCTQYYNAFYPYSQIGVAGNLQPHPLATIPATSGMKASLPEGTIFLYATFTNRDKYSSLLDSFIHTIKISPPVQKIDTKAEVDVLGNNGKIGNYSFVDLGYANRTSFTIEGQALINESVPNSQGLAAIKSVCTNLLQNYGNLINVTLDREEFDFLRYDDKLVNFSITWSFEGMGFLVSSTPYTSIQNLTISNKMFDPR